MKFAAAIVAAVALSLAALTAQAQEAAPAASFATPIAAGHWQIGGSAGWTSINDRSSTQIYIAPRAEYFLCDHVSLGAYLGAAFYRTSSDDSLKLRYTEVGPSGTVYFSRSTVAPYVTQQVVLRLPEYSKGSVGGITGLGVAMFLNEHVSISPELDASYGENSRGDLSLRVQLATYL